MFRNRKNKFKGQYNVFFLALGLPLFLLSMVIVYDLGNFLVMRSTTRTLADSAVLAAAGAVDMGAHGTGGTIDGSRFTLDSTWAYARANGVVQEFNAKTKTKVLQSRSDFALSTCNVRRGGVDVDVVVTGTYKPMWSALIGSEPMKTVAAASAHVSAGIEADIN